MMIRRALCLFLCAWMSAPLGLIAAPKRSKSAPPPTKVEASDVIEHLELTIAWYRRVVAAEQLTGIPTDLVVRDVTLQRALQALQLAFDFGHAEAALLAAESRTNGSAVPNAGLADAGASGQNLTQAAAKATDRVNRVQNQINDANSALAKARAKDRPLLQARLRELQSQLTLAQQVQNTIQGMLNVVGESSYGSGTAAGLAGQIATLERSVPEARHEPAALKQQAKEAQSPAGVKPATPANSLTNGAMFHPENQGLVALITNLLTLQNAASELDLVLEDTDGLEHNIDRLKTPLIASLRSSMARSQKLVDDTGTQTIEQIDADRKEIEALTVRFKQISTCTVPIGEQQLLVGAARSNLAGWRNSIRRQASETGKYLFIRTGFIILAILVVLAVSSVWNRATFRYIADQRRRRQFLVMRRVLVTIAIIIIVALGFVTDFSSIATYAGFLTAGIALGLQNVILSVVAYFFLIGKYGIKVGDRVTISGVTGDVIDIGLVRMYMMELTGSGSDMRPTGRTVVYANSIVFQPSALFKQVPGADSLWYTVSLTLPPETNSEEVRAKLSKAVHDVYSDYKQEIARHHQEFEKSVEMQVAAPEPLVSSGYVDTGLEFKVRYPANMKQAAVMDERILRALRDLIQKDPELQGASSPKLV